MTGAGPETEQAELFPTAPATTDRLDPGPTYFDGHGLDAIAATSKERHGLEGDGPVTRHSYLYQADYSINRRGDDESKIGKIELRGWTWTFDTELQPRYWEQLEAAAHRGAQYFNTNTVHPVYSGYLDGFDAAKGDLPPAASIRDPDESYESEKVVVDEEGAVGAVVWSTEIYDEHARLRGVAQGTSYPWLVTEETIEGTPEVDVAPHRWNVFKNDARDAYQVSAPGRRSARDRYKRGGAGASKRVYVNNRYVGRLNKDGKTYVKREYKAGHTYSGGNTDAPQWSREGLVEETDATYQAIRDGGTLYVTGENENAVYLATAGALPEGYRPADANDVSPTLEPQAGTFGGTIRRLSLRDRADPLPVEGRRDDQIIDLLGYSDPPYRETFRTGWFA